MEKTLLCRLMKPLNLPPYPVRFSADKASVFDPIRKKYIVLQPEEWVRQHFVHYMIGYLSYPMALIKVEFGIKYNQLQKRPDILAFDRNGDPLLLVECKTFEQKLTPLVFEQVSVYNKILKSPYVVVTNGLDHFCWKQDKATGKVDFLDAIPDFKDIVG